VMVPAPAVKMLVSLLRDSQATDVKVVKTKFHLLFKVGNDIYHSRLLEAKFPDVEKKVFAGTEKYELELKINRADIKAALKRAQVTASDETRELALKHDGDNLFLLTHNSTNDNYEELLASEWNGEEFYKTINLEFFEDVINALKSDKVVIAFGPDKVLPNKSVRQSSFLFQEDNFTSVVMPLRIKKDKHGNVERIHERVKEHAEAQEVQANMA